MKNYIGLNIKYLCEQNLLKQDEFGLLFDLNKGVVGTYVRESANPKIEVIQKICSYYKISIDEFVNTDLSNKKGKKYSQSAASNFVSEPPEGYGYVSLKYVELLEKTVEDKNKIIKALEIQLGSTDKSKTA